ncbi:MFS transporter [Paraliobacillus salinarum]|uniref:MFS transporter n=1 Tax=Paraliobacillus salinarum TaxID=1158996 RepID=UPI0015F4A987|nr:MFS transporter [Paraliobacillus salinarum]
MFTFKTEDIEEIAGSPDLQKALYKRTLAVILLSQTLGGAGLAAGITVGALLAQQMLGVDSLAGLPTALFTLGAAFSAYLVGRITQARGRRIGLSFGFLTGGLGALGVVIAANIDNVVFLLISLFIYGAGTSTNLQARYAGIDLAGEKQRAKAASIAMVATTFGAVAGPNLVTPMGHIAERLGMPTLAGPFLLAMVAYSLAGIVFYFFLKPDPLLVARAIENRKQSETETAIQYQPNDGIQRSGIIVGATVLILAQVIMVGIMTMTPIHIEQNGSALSAVGFVIGLHIAAMYLPSLVTGTLVDKLGRMKMVVAGALILSLAGVIAAFAPGNAIGLITLSLVLLGLGWNFGVLSGTAIVVDATTIKNRAKIQGTIDVGVAIGGSIGSISSSVIVANSSYGVLGLTGAYLSLMLVPLIIWRYLKIKRTKTPFSSDND